MWSEEKIKEYLKEKLPKERYNHVLGVVDTAEKLAKIYGEDVFKARVAALIHDCAKFDSKEEIVDLVKKSAYIISEEEEASPQILHGLAGAIIAKELMGIEDKAILDAARYHTTGKANMTVLEKIIYIADYIEPSRDFPRVDELREAAFSDLDKALSMSFDNTIKFVIDRGQILHKDTIEARNYLIMTKGK